jgi:hypothetical protein
MTGLQKQILSQSRGRDGTFVPGHMMTSVRALEKLGLVAVEDQGKMRGRGLNAERWLVRITAAGVEALESS